MSTGPLPGQANLWGWSTDGVAEKKIGDLARADAGIITPPAVMIIVEFFAKLVDPAWPSPFSGTSSVR